MKNELIHGDALTVLPTLPANSFDALITDPPYASGGTHAASRQQSPQVKYMSSGPQLHADFVGDERDQRSHLAWMRLWLAECSRVLKEGAPVLLFTDWRQLPLTTDALQCAGFTWRGVAVWDKTEGVRPQLGRFRNQAEYVVWGSKGHMPLGRRAPVLPGVVREKVRKVDKHHMTGKPTDLMRQLVRICEEGGRILDPFAGSGTTLVAADLEGYSWTGIEMTGHYFDVARSRLPSP
ncbi:site-specific DNA-methyltransferase [Stenotrophomonas maltophilia]|uniref:DNA-methyltransferase n=1 Tax=Stenotrophomonas pavanii TaxID=487698 RepID=UPI0018D3488D|nr:DNA methyltransferase [Stenotrophomonas pavanii]MBH1429859.1 site-specific DNA-methyltransferase [Stenotrophomonas maltophilia]MDZ7475083.1 site-specific DNA-methyltransferase [Stenotrophomonas pavanii]HEL4182543.1 site-specific DNA-methyltransferase [Stenotrophomonas maltophilia]